MVAAAAGTEVENVIVNVWRPSRDSVTVVTDGLREEEVGLDTIGWLVELDVVEVLMELETVGMLVELEAVGTIIDVEIGESVDVEVLSGLIPR